MEFPRCATARGAEELQKYTVILELAKVFLFLSQNPPISITILFLLLCIKIWSYAQ